MQFHVIICELLVCVHPVAVLFHLCKCTKQLAAAQRHVPLDERHADEVSFFLITQILLHMIVQLYVVVFYYH